MKLVDVSTIKSKDSVYTLVDQPMAIYHSTEEFTSNEKNYELVSSFDELLALCRRYDVNLSYLAVSNTAKYRLFTDKNIWIKTVDKFIPDYADFGGKIFYSVDDKGGFIPTDACYIKMYALVPLSNKLVLYTSSGVNSIAITKWEVTAAVRSQFVVERDSRKNLADPETYNLYIQRFMRRARPSTDMYKFAFALFNPQSPYFLDVSKAAAKTLPHFKAKDRALILKSQSFRNVMLQVMKLLVPELKKAVQDKFTTEKMVEILVSANNAAIQSGKAGDILQVFREIREIAYEEQQTIRDTTVPDLPYITDGKAPGKPKEISLPADTDGDTLPEKLDLPPEELKKIKEDLDYPDSYIMLDQEEEEIGNGEEKTT